MAILKLHAAYKDYLWGGTKLITDFGKTDYDKDKMAESWELSCHKDGSSLVENGPFAGKTLPEVIAEKGRKILGSACERFEDFPVLIKLIDAQDNLSIQVHPDNAYALREEGQYGKTEMWYVVDCVEGASLYFGFQKEISKEEFAKRIEENTLTEVLNKVPVHKGDVFFIEAGTLHAIGKGIVIAEIQQNSNVTYRVYDYGRLGADGKPRALHIQKALEVTKREKPVLRSWKEPCLASCDYFTVKKFCLDGEMMRKSTGSVGEESFCHILVLSGSGKLSCKGEVLPYTKGDSFFLEAASGEYTLEGEGEFIFTCVEERESRKEANGKQGEKGSDREDHAIGNSSVSGKKEDERPAARLRIGIDIGGTGSKIGIVDEEYRILDQSYVEVDPKDTPEEMLHKVTDAVKALLAKNEISCKDCVGIGIGCPGTVIPSKGLVTYSNNLKWENVEVTKWIQKELPLPVRMENDANAAALGEVKAGKAKGYENAVLITIGTGIGGGIIYKGKILAGNSFGGGELGHIVLHAGGELCTCGRHGCAEAYASATALIREGVRAAKKNPESGLGKLYAQKGKLTAKDIFDQAQGKGADAKAILENWITDMGELVVDVFNLLDPDIILLGGGVSRQGKALTDPLNAYLKEHSFGKNAQDRNLIEIAALGNDAGIIGAASLF